LDKWGLDSFEGKLRVAGTQNALKPEVHPIIFKNLVYTFQETKFTPIIKNS
jgi:hypothetical protein